jgi:hypothetical protein
MKQQWQHWIDLTTLFEMSPEVRLLVKQITQAQLSDCTCSLSTLQQPEPKTMLIRRHQPQ